VVGGKDQYSRVAKKCECFDLLKGVWTALVHVDLDWYGAAGVTLVGLNNRFVVAIQGKNEDFNQTDLQRFLRLDSLRLQKGWKKLELDGYQPGAGDL